MTSPDIPFALPHIAMNRRLLIAASVVLLHLGLLWSLQSGLMQRAVEVVVPVTVWTEFISPPSPRIEARPAPKAAPKPVKPSPVTKPALRPPEPVATLDPAPLLAPPVAAPAAPTAPVTTPIEASPVAAAPPAPPAPPTLELPTRNAAYLNNPKPVYPAMSRRLGEQGLVVVRVLIGVDGRAQQAELKRSSGYERLDRAALASVRSWRYVPGKRGGIPEAMWFEVPINYVLE